MDRGRLRKEQVGPVKRQVSVNLVCRDLMIPGYAVLSAGVHKDCSAAYIGLKEDIRIDDRAVNMALRREIDDHIRMLFLKEPVHRFSVRNGFLDKTEVRR